MSTRIGRTTSHGFGRRAVRSLVTAALCAALVAVTPATAHAQTVRDPDTVGDMITFDDEGVIVPAPERALNDVRRTTLTHGARRVAIRVDYVDLKKKAGGKYQSLAIEVVTNEGVRRYVSLDAWPGHWSGETQMYNRRFREVRCAVRHSIDYEADVMMVSLPRRCASNPRWVKFRVWADSTGVDGYFADDALSDDPIVSEDIRDLESSGRVRRGSSS